MTDEQVLYREQLVRIVRMGMAQVSDIKPSDWTEQHVVMGKPRPGPFRYDYTPYAREIIDCLAPDHPARKVAVMKGAQIGFSSGVIIPGIGWMIRNNPGNCYFMVGAADLVEKAVEKLDLMIQGAGLTNYIKPTVQRKKNQRTGDTNTRKEFAGGYVSIGSANNHKAIAQVDLQYIFLDDLDAMKGNSTSSGNLIKLIEQRAAAYKDIYKLFMISTPLVKSTSQIERAYLDGDRRKRMVECPCCHEPIIFKWTVNEGEMINPLKEDAAKGAGGMHWERNNHGQVIESSVGYICYKCAGFFRDKNKSDMLNGGYWDATAIPSEQGYYSYHIPSLYAPVGMFDWAHYVKDYVACNPDGQPRKEGDYQVFRNTCEGETYEIAAESPKATTIMMNVQPYEIGTIPEKLSMAQGNGRVVLLTCGSDLNGLFDDARLDYEVLAHTESGATYSIMHGSIGTFIPRQGGKITDREHWTYEHNAVRSVWPEFEKLLGTKFKTDTGRSMPIYLTCLDIGYYAVNGAYPFLDKTNYKVVGVKGEKEDKYLPYGKDLRLFRKGLERHDIYILQVGYIKDKISEYMNLKWDRNEEQPANFMNYPMPSGGLYLYENYFAHYEAEHRTSVVAKTGETLYRWVKKNTGSQNHMLDCRVYNMAGRDITQSMFALDLKVKDLSWQELAEALVKFIK